MTNQPNDDLELTTSQGISPQQEQQPPLCKHWAKFKQCAYHSRGRCKFSHPDSTIPKYCAVVGANPSSEGDINNDNIGGTTKKKLPQQPRHRTSNGRLLTRNDARAAQFRHFIATKLRERSTATGTAKAKSYNLTTATSTATAANPLEEAEEGHDCDTRTGETENTVEEEEEEGRGGLEGHRVLDVAGGKGELAYQLTHLCGVESCHVVDPRSLSLRRFILRRKRGNYHKSLFLFPEIVSSKDDEERDVGHLRCLFTEELWTTTKNGTTSRSTGGDNDDDDGATRSNELLFKQINGQATEAWVWPPPPSKNKSGARNECHHHDNNDRDDDTEQQMKAPFPTYEHATSITQSATLIVGLHPDGAVDAIVDAALHLDISFFVIPCCVYSNDFPHRRTGPLGDRPVKTYDELLDYLQAKSDGIQRAELPFEGKNICLYRVVDK